MSGSNLFEISRINGNIKNTDDILVSIAMCTYNRAKDIKRTIESVLSQSHKNIEFVIWDDGGNDNTREVVESYGDRRIHYYKGKHDYINSRNEVLKHCNGEYIMLMDSGDGIETDKIKTQLEYLVFSKVDGCLSKPTESPSFIDWGEEYKRIGRCVGEITGVTPSLMFKASVLKDFKKGIYFYKEFAQGGEDQQFLGTLIYVLGKKIHTISQLGARYIYFDENENPTEWNAYNVNPVLQNRFFLSESYAIKNGNKKVENPLIFDLGLYKADSSMTYMYLGYDVVGVECNEEIIKKIHIDNVVKEHLTIEHKCVSDKDDEEISFYISTKDDWSSTHKEIAEREEKSREIKVRTVTLPFLIKRYGCPIYCKIDIEGNDIVALRTLHQIKDRPKYISCETECVGKDGLEKEGQEFDVINELKSLGYTKFHLEKQPSDIIYSRIEEWKDFESVKKEISEKRHTDSYDFWYDVYATY